MKPWALNTLFKLSISLPKPRAHFKHVKQHTTWLIVHSVAGAHSDVGA